jgi:hypothetical protein
MVERVFSIWGCLEASVLVAYGDELILGLYPAGIYRFNGSTWDRIYKPTGEAFSAWSYDLVDDKLFIGAGTKEYGLILKYDGEKVEEVLTVKDGYGGGGGLFEALSCIDGVLYAGRRGEVWESKDGEDWRVKFKFETMKGVYLIASQNGCLYVFEGEPIKPPSRVYEFNHKQVRAMKYEIGAFRSHSPFSRSVLNGRVVVADFSGSVYLFDKGRLERILDLSKRYEVKNNIAIRPKKVGDILTLAVGTGTGVKETHGELLAYLDGGFKRVLTLPLNIHDLELYGEHIYLACNTTALNTRSWYNAGYCSVLRLPIDALGNL